MIVLTLQQDSLNWALSHAVNYGDTDIFPRPFEYDAIQHEWKEVQEYLSSTNVLEWTVRPIRRLLSPKGIYGFRIASQLDPLDFLVFTALIREIGSDVELRRVPTDENRVFSHRFLPDDSGRIFDPDVGYSTFQSVSRSKINESADVQYVAVTDISDFYSRIYHHRLENALRAYTNKNNHVQAIMRLLSGWNETETHGIPIGGTGSRLLAEAAISDVDELLLAYGVDFIRFSDDYRIFCRSKADAYRCLALLSNILHSNHGLTTNPQKTAVVTVSQFVDTYLSGHEDRELGSMRERFRGLVSELGLASPYDAINYNELTNDQKEIVDGLNLFELFHEELRKGERADGGLIRFIFSRMAQLRDASIVNAVLENVDTLHPYFSAAIEYLTSIADCNSIENEKIGRRILDLLDDSIVSELEYHRMWALHLFATSTRWNNESEFVRLYSSLSRSAIRRELILAMGRSSHRAWFQSQWRELTAHTHWPRRALIAGASCLSPDARRHWYRSIESRLDPLEKAVMRWARANPF